MLKVLRKHVLDLQRHSCATATAAPHSRILAIYGGAPRASRCGGSAKLACSRRSVALELAVVRPSPTGLPAALNRKHSFDFQR